jgi:hypothetical protein
LLPAKKAGFDIRDLARVIDESKDSIQGEIVAIGSGPKNHKFYLLKFESRIGHAQSWYREDEVFILNTSIETWKRLGEGSLTPISVHTYICN